MRTTEIRDNLEVLQQEIKVFSKESPMSLGHHLLVEDKTITIQENIKEAESMIFELEDNLKFIKDETVREIHKIGKPSDWIIKHAVRIDDKLKDWQNLLNWLEGLR